MGGVGATFGTAAVGIYRKDALLIPINSIKALKEKQLFLN